MPRDDFHPRLTEFLWDEVARHLESRIASGDISGKLPGERALAEEYGVATMTVRRAVHALRDRGLVVTLSGRGTFVADR